MARVCGRPRSERAPGSGLWTSPGGACSAYPSGILSPNTHPKHPYRIPAGEAEALRLADELRSSSSKKKSIACDGRAHDGPPHPGPGACRLHRDSRRLQAASSVTPCCSSRRLSQSARLQRARSSHPWKKAPSRRRCRGRTSRHHRPPFIQACSLLGGHGAIQLFPLASG